MPDDVLKRLRALAGAGGLPATTQPATAAPVAPDDVLERLRTLTVAEGESPSAPPPGGVAIYRPGQATEAELVADPRLAEFQQPRVPLGRVFQGGAPPFVSDRLQQSQQLQRPVGPGEAIAAKFVSPFVENIIEPVTSLVTGLPIPPGSFIPTPEPTTAFEAVVQGGTGFAGEAVSLAGSPGAKAAKITAQAMRPIAKRLPRLGRGLQTGAGISAFVAGQNVGEFRQDPAAFAEEVALSPFRFPFDIAGSAVESFQAAGGLSSDPRSITRLERAAEPLAVLPAIGLIHRAGGIRKPTAPPTRPPGRFTGELRQDLRPGERPRAPDPAERLVGRQEQITRPSKITVRPAKAAPTKEISDAARKRIPERRRKAAEGQPGFAKAAAPKAEVAKAEGKAPAQVVKAKAQLLVKAEVTPKVAAVAPPSGKLPAPTLPAGGEPIAGEAPPGKLPPGKPPTTGEIPGEAPRGKLPEKAPKPSVVKEVTTNLRKVAKEAAFSRIERGREFGKAVKETVRHAVRSGTHFIEKLGPPGKRLADETREVDFKSHSRAGTDKSDVGEALKVVPRFKKGLAVRVGGALRGKPVPDMHQQMMKVLNGRAEESTLSPEAKKAIPQLREILDRGLNELIAYNKTVPEAEQIFRTTPDGKKLPLRGAGKPFPQVPNRAGEAFLQSARDGAQSGAAFAWAQTQVKAGRFETVDAALAALARFRDAHFGGYSRYFQSTRIELPENMVEWRPNKVLPGLLEKEALFVEGSLQWGANMARIPTLLAEMKDTVRPETLQEVQRFYDIEFGRPTGLGGANKAIQAASNYESIARLGFSVTSVLRNAMQPVANLVRYPIGLSVRSFTDFPPWINRWVKEAKKIRKEAEQAGTTTGRTGMTEIERTGGTATGVSLTPFLKAETGNQIRAAYIAKLGMERDFRLIESVQKSGRLKNLMRSIWELDVSPTGSAKRRIRRGAARAMTDVELKSRLEAGKLTPEQMNEAMYRVALDTQFAMTFATKPLWWSKSPVYRLLAKFKPFAVKQTALIYNDVLKELRYGNVKPLVRFMATTFTVGEVWNVANDLIKGDERSLSLQVLGGERDPKQLGLTVMANIIDGGGVGMLADVTWGLGDYVGGPVVGTAENLSRAIQAVVQSPRNIPLAAREFIGKEIAVSSQMEGVFRNAQRIIDEGGNRMYFDQKKWRRRAINFKFGKKPTPTEMVQNTLMDVFSTKGFDVGKATLPLKYAEVAIKSGDTKAAVDYIRGLLDAEPDRQKRAKMMRTIRTSLKRRGPLGSLTREERAGFRESLSPKQRKELDVAIREWATEAGKVFSKALSPEKKSNGDPVLERLRRATKRAG